jgi:hypothetical protein
MSEALKPELDWPAIRAALQDEAAELALFVHLQGDTNGMALMYAGFEPNRAQARLKDWRRTYVLFGNELSEPALKANFPDAHQLLLRIRAGELQTIPVIRPVRPITVPERVVMKEPPHNICAKTLGCRRGHKHRGLCNTRTPEEQEQHLKEYKKEWQANLSQLAKQANGKPAGAVASVPALPPVVTLPAMPASAPQPGAALPPRCRYEILFEEELPDGIDRILLAGRSRAEFERYVLALARVIQEG